jgi:transcriptional regulator with XRE-family HTH domain
MTTNELLDLARARHSIRSEAALALNLGISANALADYRGHRRPMDVDFAWRIAELLGASPAEVIGVLFFEAEKDPQARRRWRDRLVRLGVICD